MGSCCREGLLEVRETFGSYLFLQLFMVVIYIWFQRFCVDESCVHIGTRLCNDFCQWHIFKVSIYLVVFVEFTSWFGSHIFSCSNSLDHLHVYGGMRLCQQLLHEQSLTTRLSPCLYCQSLNGYDGELVILNGLHQCVSVRRPSYTLNKIGY